MIAPVHFDLSEHTAFILDHGTTAVVIPCVTCPCLTPERHPSPLCPGCKGVGRFSIPGAMYPTTVLVVSESSAQTSQEAGIWMAGPIQVTTLPGIRLGELDKVRLVDIQDTFSEVLVRGLDDVLRFGAGVTLEYVTDLTMRYEPTRDYTLLSPNTIQWTAGGQAPAFGQNYSVRYAAFPEYLVMGNSPRLRVEGHVPQTQVVLLQRLDMLLQESL
jgi:hypothetical protein